MKPISSQGGHSAEVRMRLLLRGRSFPVVQLGPDFLFLDAPTDQAPGEGSLVLRVDRFGAARFRAPLPGAAHLPAGRGLGLGKGRRRRLVDGRTGERPVGGGPAVLRQKDYSTAMNAALRTVHVWPFSDYAPQ